MRLLAVNDGERIDGGVYKGGERSRPWGDTVGGDWGERVRRWHRGASVHVHVWAVGGGGGQDPRGARGDAWTGRCGLLERARSTCSACSTACCGEARLTSHAAGTRCGDRGAPRLPGAPRGRCGRVAGHTRGTGRSGGGSAAGVAVSRSNRSASVHVVGSAWSPCDPVPFPRACWPVAVAVAGGAHPCNGAKGCRWPPHERRRPVPLPACLGVSRPLQAAAPRLSFWSSRCHLSISLSPWIRRTTGQIAPTTQCLYI